MNKVRKHKRVMLLCKILGSSGVNLTACGRNNNVIISVRHDFVRVEKEGKNVQWKNRANSMVKCGENLQHG